MMQIPPVRQFFEMLQESQRWPPEQLRQWQEGQLGGLVEHARRTSPFYALRLNGAFGRDGFFSLGRWREIPVMTRADLATWREMLLSRQRIAGHGPFTEHSTSGSTGTPVTVVTTRWLNDMTAASIWRAHGWHGIDWSKTVLRRFYAKGSKFNDRDCLGPWGPPWLPRAKRGKLIYSSFHLDMEAFYDLAIETRADYLGLSAAAIESLASIARNRKPIKLLGFLASGQAVTPYLRQIAAEVFGAKILELYSATETGAIALPCPAGEGFHICTESVYVEILRDDGMPAEPGEAGNVVVTPLGATALPLIRYSLGDRAVMGDRCSCGITLPLLRSIQGRTREAFRHPDGRCLVSDQIWACRPLVGPFPWQIAQVGPLRFEVRYEAGEGVQPADPVRFIQQFRELIFEEAEIAFKRVPGFPLGNGQKRPEYVNEWHGAQSAGPLA
jgi:phenylacetate-CoA ligase